MQSGANGFGVSEASEATGCCLRVKVPDVTESYTLKWLKRHVLWHVYFNTIFKSKYLDSGLGQRMFQFGSDWVGR